MSTSEIKRLAESHTNSLKDTVEALRDQGADIKLSQTGCDCVFVTGVLGNKEVNDGFYLDNEQSISRLRSFNQQLRSFITTQLTANA